MTDKSIIPDQDFLDEAFLHIDAVLARAQFLLRHPVAAKNAVQECYLRAARLASTYSGANLCAWLLMILKDVIDADFSGGDPRPPRPDRLMSDQPAWDRLQALDQPATRISRKHPRGGQAMQQLFDALTDPVREVVMLREFDALSYKEIALLIGAPVGIVMARLAQAQSILQIAARS